MEAAIKMFRVWTDSIGSARQFLDKWKQLYSFMTAEPLCSMPLPPLLYRIRASALSFSTPETKEFVETLADHSMKQMGMADQANNHRKQKRYSRRLSPPSSLPLGDSLRWRRRLTTSRLF